MKQILCGDCNNNILIVTSLIKKIIKEVKVEEWEITEFEATPVDLGDWSGIGASENEHISGLYIFSQRLHDERIIILNTKEFISLLKDIRSIYYAEISFAFMNQINTISIFDGDIIEITGYIEKIL